MTNYSALFQVTKSELEPPWLRRALNEIDVIEVPGPDSNPRIIEYHKSTSFAATSDEVAWCSSFACWCMEKSGIDSPRSARARDWLNWGFKVEAGILGCVVILSRGKNPIQGHVGFYLEENLTHIRLISGNTHNKVCMEYFLKSDILGYRVPDEDIWRPEKINDEFEGH